MPRRERGKPTFSSVGSNRPALPATRSIPCRRGRSPTTSSPNGAPVAGKSASRRATSRSRPTLRSSWPRSRPCRGFSGLERHLQGPGLPGRRAPLFNCWLWTNTSGWPIRIAATTTKACCFRCRLPCNCCCSAGMWPTRRMLGPGCAGSVAKWRSSSTGSVPCRWRRWTSTI